jgi:hypothetical protein
MSINKSFALAGAIALLVAGSAAFACGICIEDRVAAVFDPAQVAGAVAKHRHVAYFGVEGELPATAAARRAVQEALYAGGGVRGTARVSLESASAAVEFDPARTTLDRVGARAGQRLAAKGLSLTPFRFVDEAGVLKEPVTKP